MPRNRQIKSDFWSDEKIGSLTYLQRLLFMGMWTFSDDSGVCRSNPVYLRNNIFPYDDKIKLENIKLALLKLNKIQLIKFITSNGESFIFIKNWFKHQKINRASNFRYIYQKNDNYDSIEYDYNRAHGVLNETSLPNVNVNVNVNVNENDSPGSETSLKKSSKRIFKESDIEFKLSNYLLNWILKNNPNYKKPTKQRFQKWCDYIRKMIKLDNRNTDDIKIIIKFCQTDSFWLKNILSTKKLRDQFDKLMIAMKSNNGFEIIDKKSPKQLKCKNINICDGGHRSIAGSPKCKKRECSKWREDK